MFDDLRFPAKLKVMKIKTLLGLSAAFCVSISGSLAVGQDAVPDHSLSDFTLGDHISGDKVDLSKLEGKVVTIEYWGTR